jgi:FMN phosphatase YigB (HAD superfamily)
VGDSIDSDVAGASGVGIRPVLIDRDARYGGYSDHPRITGLAELPGVMDAMEGR